MYQDIDNVTQRTRTFTDSASVRQHRITRQAAVEARTTSEQQATRYVAVALEDGRAPRPRAQTLPIGKVYDKYGSPWPLYSVKAGDTVTIRNLPPTIAADVDRLRTFVIAGTRYDAMTDALQVEPEAPLPRLETFVARMEEGLS